MKIIRYEENLVLFEEEIEGYRTNAAVLLLPGKNLIIDTLALPSQISVVLSFFRENGRVQMPTWIINTHHHWDHIWGNKAVADCPIIAHSLCLKHIKEEGEKTLKKFQAKDQNYKEVEIILPNITFNDKLTLYENGCTLDLSHCPSHTEDCILIYIRENKLLFAGDTLEYPFPMLEWEGGTSHYLKELELLLDTQLKIIVPAHGTISGRELLESNHHYIYKVWEAAQKAKLRSEPLESLLRLPLEFFFLNGNLPFLRSEDFETHKRNIERAYSDAGLP